jgi:hypothetical protein
VERLDPGSSLAYHFVPPETARSARISPRYKEYILPRRKVSAPSETRTISMEPLNGTGIVRFFNEQERAS